jgi:hypothetical protein
MIKSVGRFVTRPIGDGNSDLLLGSLMKGMSDYLIANYIYEIREVLGVLTIVPIGDCMVPESNINGSSLSCTWGMEYQYVGQVAGKWLLVSKQEYEELNNDTDE